MRVISWNMGANTGAVSSRHRAWEYLFAPGELNADLALVQEAVLPDDVLELSLVFERAWDSRKWGTAIAARSSISLRPIEFGAPEGGRAVVAVAESLDLTLASLHARLVNGRVVDSLLPTFEALFTGPLVSGNWIAGGDLNSCRKGEDIWPGYRHAELFDWLDARGANLYWNQHGREGVTFVNPRTGDTTQADHLFSDRATAARVKDVYIGDAAGLSDHAPLVVELSG